MNPLVTSEPTYNPVNHSVTFTALSKLILSTFATECKDLFTTLSGLTGVMYGPAALPAKKPSGRTTKAINNDVRITMLSLESFQEQQAFYR